MNTPVRIQLSRKRGFRLPENTVVVSRPSKWGNPFKVGEPGIASNEEAKAAFLKWTEETEAGAFVCKAAKVALRGKNLACWCKPGSPCHADVLLTIANSK